MRKILSLFGKAAVMAPAAHVVLLVLLAAFVAIPMQAKLLVAPGGGGGGSLVNGTYPTVSSTTAAIAAGNASNRLMSKTKATAFKVGTESILDRGIVSFSAFVPASAPEPTAALLLSFGTLALAGLLCVRSGDR